MKKATVIAIFLSGSAAYAATDFLTRTKALVASAKSGTLTSTDTVGSVIDLGLQKLGPGTTVSQTANSNFDSVYYNKSATLTSNGAFFSASTETNFVQCTINSTTHKAYVVFDGSGNIPANWVLSFIDSTGADNLSIKCNNSYTLVSDLVTALNTWLPNNATITGTGIVYLNQLATALSNIGGSATNITSAIGSVSTKLSYSGSLYSQATAILTGVSGSTYTTVSGAVSAVSSLLGGNVITPNELYARANNIKAKVHNNSGSASVFLAVSAVASSIGTSGSDLYTQATTAAGNINTGTQVVNTAITTAAGKIAQGATTIPPAMITAIGRIHVNSPDIKTAISDAAGLLSSTRTDIPTATQYLLTLLG